MIDSSIPTLVENVKTRWEKLLELSPLYRLDNSWPAVAVWDALTYLDRGGLEDNEISKELRLGAAASLGMMAYEIWKKFGADVRLENKQDGISLKALSGPALSGGETEQFKIEKHLNELLNRPPRELEFIHGFTRQLNQQNNLLSLFALGLFSGLSPFSEGPWATQSAEAWAPQAQIANRALASQCAEFYAEAFPEEPLGQMAELYLAGLVYPPLLKDEDFPCRRAVKGILELCSEYKISASRLLKLGANLSQMPDETISACGLVLYTALLETEPSPQAIALAKSKGLFLGVLRPAMLDVRRHFKLEDDWLNSTEFSEKQKARIAIECKLGFIPWLRMSEAKVLTCDSDRELAALIQALAGLDLKSAIRISDSIIELDPTDVEVRLQRVYLDLIQGDAKSAETQLQRLLTEPESEGVASIYNAAGLIQIVLGQPEKGLSYLNQARNLALDDTGLSGDYSNNYAWAFMCANKPTEALEVLDLTLTRSPNNLTALLNKIVLLKDLNQLELCKEPLRAAIRLCPFDRRVFSSAMELVAGGLFT